ncbi:hypothetical protein IKF23_03835 [Candidatus Saccharibacteria bacterium]|nr:hypothetical protein [Candidatus Saccharibacteria bacterium]
MNDEQLAGMSNTGMNGTQGMQTGAGMNAEPMMQAQMPNVQAVTTDNTQPNPVTGAPMMMAAPISSANEELPLAYRKEASSIVKTIVIIALSLVSATFVGLFLWMLMLYNGAKTDVDGQVADAVVAAVDDNTTKLESEFAEREKYPFRTFAGPADYGSLTFEYPQTWSVYIAKDARNGGDFEAYFNPIEVYAVSNETINSMRLSIRDRAFDDIVNGYQRELEGEQPKMRLDLVTIGKDSNITANRYTGVIPGTEHNGIVVIFKIRDKTVVMQTDSMLFQKDFDTLLSSLRFNA